MTRKPEVGQHEADGHGEEQCHPVFPVIAGHVHRCDGRHGQQELHSSKRQHRLRAPISCLDHLSLQPGSLVGLGIRQKFSEVAQNLFGALPLSFPHAFRPLERNRIPQLRQPSDRRAAGGREAVRQRHYDQERGQEGYAGYQ
ncbi:MAG: hypothetical protein HW398_1060 [Acidobacteria bacterium]|nr:hypothetical protein [Acidobacteriota bacterium]